MSVSIKTEHEIELMRESGHLLEKVHDGLIPYIKPGMSTKEIDRIGEDMIRSMGCIPNFLNYGGFPGSFCISLNDEVVHGIPSEDKIIQDGDLVKIDAGLIYKGMHSDAARTHAYCTRSGRTWDWYPSPRGSADSQLPSEAQGSEITSRHDTCY